MRMQNNALKPPGSFGKGLPLFDQILGMVRSKSKRLVIQKRKRRAPYPGKEVAWSAGYAAI